MMEVCSLHFYFDHFLFFNFQGIRSLSFHNNVVTIGTGFGSCSFLDLRTYQFIKKADGSICQLKAGDGWLVSLDIHMQLIQ